MDSQGRCKEGSFVKSTDINPVIVWLRRSPGVQWQQIAAHTSIQPSDLSISPRLLPVGSSPVEKGEKLASCHVVHADDTFGPAPASIYLMDAGYPALI